MRIFRISKVTTFLVSIMLMTIILCCSSQVQAEQDGDYTNTVTDGEVQITMCQGTGATLDQIVTEIMSFQGYLNPSEKDSLNKARTNLLTAVQDGTLSSAADGLLTEQVVAKFQAKGVTRADAKMAIIKTLLDFQAIHYSDDKATIESALVKFNTENGETFRALFGDDFNVELFYGFMMATQDELQKEIKKEIKKNPYTLLGLIGGSRTEIKDKLLEWLITALHNVADPANSKYHVFDQKLADIGWSIESLVETQRKVGAVIDPSNAAEKAVAMCVIRSQIQCKIDGTICDALTPLTLEKGDNKLELVLSVKGINTGAFKLAGLLAWKTDNSAIATVAEDGSSIKAGTANGTTVITAYRINDSQVETNELIRITVVTAPVNVTGVSLNQSSTSITVGENESLTATILPTNATNQNVTWDTSDPTVATVDQNGKVVGVKAGIAIITVTTVDGNKTDTCKITVKSPKIVKVRKVSLNKKFTSINAGANETLIATVSPTTATNQDVTWKSSNISVATVDSNGKVEALNAGTAVIIVTTVDGKRKAVCRVTVPTSVTGISLNNSSLTMNVGAKQSLKAIIIPTNSSNKNVTWTSSVPSVATVNLRGKVVGISPGTTIISATTQDGNKIATCVVNVNAPVIKQKSTK